MKGFSNYLKAKLIAGSLIMFCLSVHAQNETDVARFISTDFGGTARFNAMGGAMGALGGDPSAIVFNPAGMGLFRSSEMSISPTFVPLSSTATFYGKESTESDFNFNLNNLGYVRAFELKDRGKWRFLQFGLSYAPLKNLNADHVVQGIHADGSLSQEISADANGVDPVDFETNEPFYVFPAYQTYLIDPDSSAGPLGYTSAIPLGTRIDQRSVLSRRGRIGETVFAASANYDDRLYLGFGFGFNKVVYDEFLDYEETVLDTGVTDLLSFSLVQDVEMRGSGMDIKLGLIYKVTDNIRLGASYVSPTWNFMNTSWNTTISTRFDNGDAYTQAAAALGSNDYYMTSPARLMGSIGFVISKNALLDVDYEYVDYAGGKLRSYRPTPIDFSNANAQLQADMVSVGNIRAGLELRHKSISVRGGYAIYPSPYKEGVVTVDAAKTILSGGVGYRKNHFSLDLALKESNTGADYFAYAPDRLEVTQIEERQTSLIITAGYRF